MSMLNKVLQYLHFSTELVKEEPPSLIHPIILDNQY